MARQRQFFEACPFEWRAQVREHVKTAQARIEQVRAHKHLVGDAARKDPLPPAPDNSFRISDYKKSAPEVGNRELAKLKAIVGGAHGH
ncbi:hypothetical protein N5J43_07115 [Pseudomonas nicosulfuronedens]|uniref:hypothetical protein n=1 Tax=Pseudomonas nicosulfuronedens TaxID=2571105 RepID=UPI0024478D65|nr:hypothetical protein [Pseudomonas nicosulfuronedens]MDH1009336.1 hypothetical protein [Pseudomonas nicosulfuronedens]MDH1978714.1 hypothetical protein [Pseudomonas nicosulfuronedens]MDH2026424.1 hypothetical protein [Pseudomonas nicosulfuronedens]